MTSIVDDVFELLQDDMLCHAGLVQLVKYRCGDEVKSDLDLENVLEQVLQTGESEIGNALLVPTGDYVEFVAWRGSVMERVKRAVEEVAAASEIDNPFAYWLTLRVRVDRYENGDRYHQHE